MRFITETMSVLSKQPTIDNRFKVVESQTSQTLFAHIQILLLLLLLSFIQYQAYILETNDGLH